MTDPNTIQHYESVNPSGELEPSSSQLRSPSRSSHFYSTSLPSQPLRNPAARPALNPRQDLDQVTTFSEILDSLKNYPIEDNKEAVPFPRSQDMTYMAPLGPSQVDIGNLSCR